MSKHTIAVLLTAAAALLAASSTDTFAQSRSKFTAKSNADWDNLALHQCSDPTTPVCASTAIALASTQCMTAAKFFRKDKGGWKVAGLLFIITSAASTAVGASSTIATAKIWSTLGGTSALGAVTATVNANESDDQTSLASISATLADFRKFVTSGGQNGAPPPNQVTANAASTYAAQCVAAATTSASPDGDWDCGTYCLADVYCGYSWGRRWHRYPWRLPPQLEAQRRLTSLAELSLGLRRGAPAVVLSRNGLSITVTGLTTGTSHPLPLGDKFRGYRPSVGACLRGCGA